MDDARWLESCKEQGRLNATDLSRWVLIRHTQIKISGTLMSVSAAVSLLDSILCVTLLILIVSALRNPSVKLRTYSNEYPEVCNRFRVEYVVLLNFVVWIISGGTLFLFSTLFHILESGHKHCQPWLIALLLLLLIVTTIANITSYFQTGRRLKQKESVQRETNDAPIAKQCLLSHKIAKNKVILHTVATTIVTVTLVFLIKSFLDLQQLKVIYFHCDIDLVLNLVDNIQLCGTIIVLTWLTTILVNCVLTMTSDYNSLLWFIYKNDLDTWTDDNDVTKKVKIRNVFSFSA
ncbi:unnamed protein product [Bursaphelenchus okinawaensis]|uniref:Uncharacterized protein n=1 Tax=Bursaphelenchus okinawaensis TaxID=465554 RepID=A0A811KUY0_9BILA|nr:unnamed protein product [Bursaphelenchus okinawaensis]CAG9112691.1 unnamed protein product [Bursaphelenchus okinawaensis]